MVYLPQVHHMSQAMIHPLICRLRKKQPMTANAQAVDLATVRRRPHPAHLDRTFHQLDPTTGRWHRL